MDLHHRHQRRLKLFRSNLQMNGGLILKPPEKVTSCYKLVFANINSDNFLFGMKMVIDFFASWCGPCKLMEPIIHEFAAKYTNVVFVKIDVDKLADVAREFGIKAMPTFILMKKGKQVDQLIGAKKEELQKKIEKHRGAT
ncbi:hypothetical protein LguiA_032680 [Lonicera macranthoides]